MKKLIFLTTFVLWAAIIMSQETLMLYPTELAVAIKNEDSINSINKGFHSLIPFEENVEDIYNEWPYVRSRVLIFKRTIDEFYPNQHSYYFFDRDSIVKLIYYKWGFGNLEVEAKDEVLKRQSSRTNEYLSKYYSEKDKLIVVLGKPNQIEISKDNASCLKKKTVWDFEDKRVILEMVAEKRATIVGNERFNRPLIVPLSKVQITILIKE